MLITKKLALLGVSCCLWANVGFGGSISIGPLYDDFELTLAPGHRTEILGPAFYSEKKEDQKTWAIPILTLAHTEDPTSVMRNSISLIPC